MSEARRREGGGSGPRRPLPEPRPEAGPGDAWPGAPGRRAPGSPGLGLGAGGWAVGARSRARGPPGPWRRLRSRPRESVAERAPPRPAAAGLPIGRRCSEGPAVLCLCVFVPLLLLGARESWRTRRAFGLRVSASSCRAGFLQARGSHAATSIGS